MRPQRFSMVRHRFARHVEYDVTSKPCVPAIGRSALAAVYRAATHQRTEPPDDVVQQATGTGASAQTADRVSRTALAAVPVVGTVWLGSAYWRGDTLGSNRG